jgi:hypothetical protein
MEFEAAHRVARGLDETCGRERNSSRSIVPELSWAFVQKGLCLYGLGAHLVELHESLAESVHFILVDWRESVRETLDWP